MVEQPQDPMEWKGVDPGQPEHPSFLVWPETMQMTRRLALKMVRLDQGPLGHATRKPTTLLTNIPEIEELEGTRGGGEQGRWPETTEERIQMSRGLAEWAPGLVQRLQKAIRRISSEERWVKALTAKDKRAVEAWKKHCQANHLPYRRDCPVCVEAAGRDRPRRRQECPESYCWSIDIAGPFREGRDAEVKHSRYFLVSTITIPVDEKGPQVEALQAMKSADTEPVEDEGLEGDDGVEAVEDLGEDPWQQVDEKEEKAEAQSTEQEIHEKTPPSQGLTQQPSLRRLQDGGECNGDEVEGEDDTDWEERLKVWQHSSLQEILKEQNSRMMEGRCNPGEIYGMMRIAEEVKILEERLIEENHAKLRKLDKKVEEEVLQTRVVSLEEVQMDLMGWKEAFEKEVTTLMNGPVSKISKEEVERMQTDGVAVEILPMKAVATVKPPGKRKGRVVVCGNYAEDKSEDVSVGGICSMALRAAIHSAAVRDWSIGTVDVKAAFL